MCKLAGLLVGWDYASGRALVTRADCDSWSCPECANRMRSRWVLRAQIGVRQYLSDGRVVDFVTMTSHEKLKTFEATEAIWRKAWSKLYAALKHRNKAMEYFIVPERHKDGRMHVHALWTAGVTQKWVKDAGRKRGLGYQAKVVHVLDAGVATRYVTKYLAKDMQKDMPAHFRRVRVSRGWADVPAPDSELTGLKWDYVGTNGALWVVYQEARTLGMDLIDLETGEFFDDVDLGTIVYAE